MLARLFVFVVLFLTCAQISGFSLQPGEQHQRVANTISSISQPRQQRDGQSMNVARSSIQGVSVILHNARCYNWKDCKQSTGCVGGTAPTTLDALVPTTQWISCEQGSNGPNVAIACARHMLSNTCDVSTQDDEDGWFVYEYSGGYSRGTTTYQPAPLPFVAGSTGVDGCPDGYKKIDSASQCATASFALGYTYDGSANSNVGASNSVCNWCGGCNSQTTRVDDGHGSYARWICSSA